MAATYINKFVYVQPSL